MTVTCQTGGWTSLDTCTQVRCLTADLEDRSSGGSGEAYTHSYNPATDTIEVGDEAAHTCEANTWITTITPKETTYNITCLDNFSFDYDDAIECREHTYCPAVPSPSNDVELVTPLPVAADGGNYRDEEKVQYHCPTDSTEYALFNLTPDPDSQLKNREVPLDNECLWTGVWNWNQAEVDQLACLRVACGGVIPPKGHATQNEGYWPADYHGSLPQMPPLFGTNIAYTCPDGGKLDVGEDLFQVVGTCTKVDADPGTPLDIGYTWTFNDQPADMQCRTDAACPLPSDLSSRGITAQRISHSEWLSHTFMTASAFELYDSGRGASNVVDGSIDNGYSFTYWGKVVDVTTDWPWLQLDLGHERWVVEVAVYFNSDYYTYNINWSNKMYAWVSNEGMADESVVLDDDWVGWHPGPASGPCDDPVAAPVLGQYHAFHCFKWGQYVLISRGLGLHMLFQEVKVKVHNYIERDAPAGMTDCSHIHAYGLYEPGIYHITDPKAGLGTIPVQCHDGWTLILARGQNDKRNFNRNWNNILSGFYFTAGDTFDQMKEHWLGLENVYDLIMAGTDYRLRIEMIDADGNFRRVDYDDFKLVDRTEFALNVNGFETNNEWGIRDDLSRLNTIPFSTKDEDHGGKGGTCATDHRTSGWLDPAQSCVVVNPFAYDNHNSKTATGGIYWPSFEGEANSLQSLIMMVKPVDSALPTPDPAVVTAYHESFDPASFQDQFSFYCNENGKWLLDSSGAPLDYFTTECKWDNTWTEDDTGITCDWAYCDEPPEPPAANNLKISGLKQVPTPVDGTVTYVCEDGMHFESMSTTEITLTCLVENKWTTINWNDVANKCRPTATCPALDPPPTEASGTDWNSTATLVRPGKKFGPCNGLTGTQFAATAGRCPELNLKLRVVNHVRVSATTFHAEVELEVSPAAQVDDAVFILVYTSHAYTNINFDYSVMVNNDAVGYRPDEVLLELVAPVAAGTSTDRFTFIYEDDGQDFCIYNAACSIGEEWFDPDYRWDTDVGNFDPTADTYHYDAQVKYTCGKARAFLVDAAPEPDVTAEEQVFTCGWDSQWDDLTALLPCKWTQCLEPMVPPDTIVHGPWDGLAIEFETPVSYICDRGMHFVASFTQEEVIAICKPGNTWQEPSAWGSCVDTKECSAPPALPDADSTAYAAHTGTRYGPVCVDRAINTISSTCDAVSITYSDDLAGSGRPGFDFNIVAPTAPDYKVDAIYFQMQFTLPLEEDDIHFVVDSSYAQFTEITRLRSRSTFAMGTNSLGVGGVGLDPGQSQSAMLYLDFDPDVYGYACIESVDCGYCNGEDCLNMKETLYDIWEAQTFFDSAPAAKYMYESEVVYQCGPGRSFEELPSGTKHATQTLTCGWGDGTSATAGAWEPSTSLMSCVWTHCLEPPPADAASHLSPDWNGDPIAFGVSVPYTCDRGMKFESSFTKTSEDIECLTGNDWADYNTGQWPKCVDTKYCNAPVAPGPKEDGAHAIVKNSGMQYGIVCVAADNVWEDIPHGGGTDTSESGCVWSGVRPQIMREAMSEGNAIDGIVGNANVVTYKIKIGSDVQRMTKALMSFSQPVQPDVHVRVVKSGTVILEETESETTLKLTITVQAAAPTADEFTLQVRYAETGQEPCLVHLTCEFCDDPTGDCAALDEDWAENARTKQAVTKYGSTLEYNCSLGREFLMDEPSWTTEPTDTLTCNWLGQWEPYNTLKDCVWVACIDPTDPPHLTFAPYTDAPTPYERHLVNDYVEGTVVQFGDNVTYTCEEDYYFEEDHELESFEITCQEDGSWTDLPLKWCLHEDTRYCPDPPSASLNGGLMDWTVASTGVTTYKTEVTYSCDKARLLQKWVEDENGTLVELLHETQTFECQWDQTWSPDETVEPCVWIQCLNPPLPEGLGLAFEIAAQETEPIEFFDNVTYVCEHNGLFFEDDRDMESFKVTCYDDGTFDTPSVWPRCVSAVECDPPPEKPLGGSRIYSGQPVFDTVVEYTCGAYASFYDPVLDDSYDTLIITCQWNKTWTRDTLDTCLWSHCNIIPEPPASTGLIFVPDEDAEVELHVLTDTAEYAPEIPVTIAVAPSFGNGDVLVIDGYMADVIDNLPTFALEDKAGVEVFSFTIEPSYSNIYVKSALNNGYEQSQQINVDFGIPIRIYVDYSFPDFEFSVEFNGEAVDEYGVPDDIPDIEFATVRVSGDVIVNFAGFGPLGYSPAIKTGTVVTYGCPEGLVFAHDWYRKPVLPLECTEDGSVALPDEWPECIDPFPSTTPGGSAG